MTKITSDTRVEANLANKVATNPGCKKSGRLMLVALLFVCCAHSLSRTRLLRGNNEVIERDARGTWRGAHGTEAIDGGETTCILAVWIGYAVVTVHPPGDS